MRIVQLTPGTGNFHCGSCLRDAALVRALRARGHDVLMVPLYLPHVLDEPDDGGDSPIFLGGLSVYLDQRWPGRRRPAWLDRALSSRRMLGWVSHLAGMTSARALGASTVSMLQEGGGAQAAELERLAAWLLGQPRPDVMVLSNALLSALARPLRERLGAPVVCSLQGEDAFLDGLPEPWRSQAWSLLAARCREVDQFMPVSEYYSGAMAGRLALPADRVRVVYPGIDLAGFPDAATPPVPPVIGYLARLHPDKGLGRLVEAFIELRRRGTVPGVRLRIAGAMTGADRRYVDAQRRRLAAAGCADAAEFHPNLDRARKLEFLRGLSALSVPATYGEAFGLYVVEALAVGVPVVQPRHGAFPEVIGRTGGGLLCEPEPPAALADALEQLLRDPALARRLGEAGRTAVRSQFTAAAMAAGVESVLEDVLRRAV